MTEATRLAESWEGNAEAWTEAVRSGAIESRRLATDRALLDSLEAVAPRRVLDLGCGEGWLVRHLTTAGIEALGIDGSASLIARAEEAGGGRYLHLSYAGLIAAPKRLGGPYDCIVANFALFEAELQPLIACCRGLLEEGGSLVVQTLHPWAPAGAPDEAYREGWREERFEGFASGSWQPMPWYCRTLEGWVELLAAGGFLLSSLREPRHPASARPLSLLLRAEPRLPRTAPNAKS